MQPIQIVARAAVRCDHAAGHLGKLGGGAFDLQIAQSELEFLDLFLRRFDRHIAGADELLIRFLGVFKLGAVLAQLLLGGLQPERILPGGIAVSRPQLRPGLGAQLAFLGLEPFDLGDQPLTHSRMRRETLVVLGDLFAEILLLDFEQSLGIRLLESPHKETQKAAKKVGDALENNVWG